MIRIKSILLYESESFRSFKVEISLILCNFEGFFPGLKKNKEFKFRKTYKIGPKIR